MADPAAPGNARYGLTDRPSVYGWEAIDPRFDARGTDYANEPHRFGYIVEIDPEDPASVPRKHTALGRFKHEGATIRVDRDGTVAAYMGDDERFDYLYKFVSRWKYRPAARGRPAGTTAGCSPRVISTSPGSAGCRIRATTTWAAAPGSPWCWTAGPRCPG